MLRLHSFFRSSAAYRVRIGLAWKQLPFETAPVSLPRGAHRSADYRSRNPQGLVPLLEDGTQALAQSLAILEYLEEVTPAPPLLPAGAAARARVRAFALAIACDLHPLNNLRVLEYLRGPLGQAEPVVRRWYAHWIAAGLAPLEETARRESAERRYCVGAAFSIADCCLVPQLYNARRFECDLAPYPTLTAIGTHLESLPAVAAAHPDRQPDAG